MPSHSNKRPRNDSKSPERPVRTISTNRSISQSTQSYLEQIPSAVFTYICSFLTIPEKLPSLSRLSRSVNQLFNISTCCSTNHMDLIYRQHLPDLQRDAVLQSFPRRLTVASYIKQVTIDLSRWFYVDPNGSIPIASIYQSLLCHNLQSLIVKEAVFDRLPYEPQSHFVTLFHLLASSNQPIKLRRIQIIVERPTSTYRYPLVEWQGLRQCTELTHFELEDVTGVTSSCILTGLLDHVPDSLTELRILSPVCMQEDWKRALQRVDVLPNLRVFSPGGSAPQAFGQELCVVMQSSHQMRPFTSLEIEIDSSVDLGLFTHLTSVQLSMDADAFDRFITLPDHTLSKLQSCWLTILAEDPGDDGQPENPRIDLSGLAIFLSKRPMTEIMFQAKHCFCVPWTDEAVIAMSRQSQLVTLCLTLNGQASFVTEDIRHLLSPGCWPKLTRVEMDSFFCTWEQMEAFIAAMPAVVEFQWYDSMIESTFVMSKLVQSCPSVQRIVCCSDIAPTHLREVRETLQHTSFRDSVIESVFIDELDDAALHYVLTKLSVAPCLTEFKLVPKLPQSTFRACCYRVLPKLKVFSVDDAELFDDDREGVATQGFHPGDIVMFYAKDANNSIVFNTTLDAHGRDGRQALFDALYDTLSPAEKQLLHQFDSGDYNAWDSDQEPDDMPELDDDDDDGEDGD